MGQSEITIFIILINIILLILITSIIIFILEYRKRKLLHEKEKAQIEKQHKLDLLNNLLQVQQQTMQFIGSEIHDSVAQKLTLASIYSQQLEFKNTHPELLSQLGKISKIINDSLIELRDLAKTLSDNIEKKEDLNKLLFTEMERVNDTGICRMFVDSDGIIGMNNTVKSFLFRVIQEFIQNSLKHSGCNSIKIMLRVIGEGLQIIISDDGIGFDKTISHSGGMGLNNMKRRINLLGGQFNLQSEPGKGTKLELFIESKNLLQK